MAKAPAAALPELTAAWWEAHSVALASVRFSAMAKRLPVVLRQAIVIAWRASPRDTLAALLFNLLTGVATAFGLLATRRVLHALFASGATLDRVRAAVPSLIVVAVATATSCSARTTSPATDSSRSPRARRVHTT